MAPHEQSSIYLQENGVTQLTSWLSAYDRETLIHATISPRVAVRTDSDHRSACFSMPYRHQR